MDAADRIILKTLAENARTPIKGLAEKAFLSSPAVSARVDRMEKAGVIRSYQASLNLRALGYEILAFINLAMLPERRDEFRQWLDSCINVLECHHVTGAYSLLMKVAFTNTAQMEQFVSQLQIYGTTQTQIVFSTLVEPRQAVEHND